MMKLKNWPWWVKGGVCGILFYIVSVGVTFASFAIGPAFYKTMPSWFFDPLDWIFSSLGYFVFYPAMYLNNNYEALDFIIPVNLLFYCLVGVVVAFVVKTIKEGVELV